MSPGIKACIVRVRYNATNETWGYAIIDDAGNVLKDFDGSGYLTAKEAQAAGYDDAAFDTSAPQHSALEALEMIADYPATVNNYAGTPWSLIAQTMALMARAAAQRERMRLPMTKPQNAFNDLVAEIGLSTTGVASIAGVTSRAVYHWQSGKTAPPQSLLLLLQAMVQGKVTREWIDDQLATQPPTTGDANV